jgi:hypothetical protein
MGESTSKKKKSHKPPTIADVDEVFLENSSSFTSLVGEMYAFFRDYKLDQHIIAGYLEKRLTHLAKHG